MKRWEDLSKYEQDQQYYSDLYKDVYGFRPRWTPSEEEMDAAMERLGELLTEKMAEDEAREKVATEGFENIVAKLMTEQKVNRTTAIKWLMDAEDATGDQDYFRYLMGLPYNYKLI